MTTRCYLEGTVLDERTGQPLEGAKVYIGGGYASATIHTEPTAPTFSASITGSMYAAETGGSALPDPKTTPLTTDERGHWEGFFTNQQRVTVVYSDNNHTAVLGGTSTVAPMTTQLAFTKDINLAPADQGAAATTSTAPVDYTIQWTGAIASAINGRTGITDYGGAGNAGGISGSLFSSVWNAVMANLGARGPNNHPVSIASASKISASVVEYVTGGNCPQVQDWITVSGYTGGQTEYNQATPVQVTSVNTAVGSFRVGKAVSAATANQLTASWYSRTPGGLVQLQNLGSDNSPFPAHATLYTCHGLSLFGTGISKAGQDTPSSLGSTTKMDLGSVLIQATTAFTSVMPDGVTSYTDGSVLFDARGGDTSGRTSSSDTSGRMGNVYFNLGLDGNNVANITMLALGKGTGNAMHVKSCQIRGGRVCNMQIGATNDTGGSSDVFMENTQIINLGSAATARGCLVVYVGDMTCQFLNVGASGNNYSLVVAGGALFRIFNSHIGGGGSNYSDIFISSGQNIEFTGCYIDNIGSNVLFCGGVHLLASDTMNALTFKNCYFNVNGSVPWIFADVAGTGTGAGMERIEISGCRANGNQISVGGVYNNAPAILAIVGGNLRSRHLIVKDNKAYSTNDLIVGDTQTDTGWIESSGNVFGGGQHSGGGGAFGSVKTAVGSGAGVTSWVVYEDKQPDVINFGGETVFAGTATPTSPLFIPFSIVCGTERVWVTARTVPVAGVSTYTVVRGVMNTTRAAHSGESGIGAKDGAVLFMPSALDGVQEQHGQETLTAGTVSVTHSMWAEPKSLQLTLKGMSVGFSEMVAEGTWTPPDYTTSPRTQGSFNIVSSDDTSGHTVMWSGHCDHQ